ncbi:FG-GAP-like repeat-containing protein [Candidatus Omnitrophota bacterium]
MQRKLSIPLKVIIVTALLSVSMPAFATTPIPPGTECYQTKDGRTIFMEGDPKNVWFYTREDGKKFTVIKADNTWHYAERGDSGELIPSGELVLKEIPAPSFAENLYPVLTGQALEEFQEERQQLNDALKNINSAHRAMLEENQASSLTTVYTPHVVFVEFPDANHTYEADDFLRMIASKGEIDPYAETPDGLEAYGSTRDYWQEVSFGEVEIEPIPYFPPSGEWFMMPGTREQYLTDASSFNNDFLYTTGIQLNSDDRLIIVAAGFEDNRDSIFWPQFKYTYIWGNFYTITMLPEKFIENRFLFMGTVAHEMGHLLIGLKDYYYSVHNWGLMGFGSFGYGPGWGLPNPEKPVHLSAINRINAGFANVETIGGGGAFEFVNYILPDVETTGIIAHLNQGDDDTNFYLEVRQPNGNVFDSGITADSAGLVVWFTTETTNGYFDYPFDIFQAWEKNGYFNPGPNSYHDTGYWADPTTSAYPGFEGHRKIDANTHPPFYGNDSKSIYSIYNIQKEFDSEMDGFDTTYPVSFDLKRFSFEEKLKVISFDDDDEGESQGNGDGIPDVGERVEVTFQIINQGTEPIPASDGSFNTDSDVRWITDNPFSAVIDGGGRDRGAPRTLLSLRSFPIAEILPGQYVETEAVFDIITEPVDGSYHMVRLIRDNRFHISFPVRLQIWIGPPVLQYGWPQMTGNGQGTSSPALADFDGDGNLEVVIGHADYVYAWHSDGTLVSGWPVDVTGTLDSSPAIADIDSDGDLEIAIGSHDNKIYAIHHDGAMVSGWPVSTNGPVTQSSPALADLDGDGNLEVIVGAGNEVYAFHNNGTLVTGWPNSTGDHIESSPAVADIDNDGDFEIVIGSLDNNVYAWHHDGTLVSGWPVTTTSDVISSPAVADLDGDGDLEIVVGSGNYIYAWHHDGTLVSGWPEDGDGALDSSPAIVDLDGNGDLEIVIASSLVRFIYAFNHDGTLHWRAGYGELGSNYIFPAIADLNSDGELEIIASCPQTSRTYVYKHTGEFFWYVRTYDGGPIFSSAAIADLDGDQSFEIVVGSQDTGVYIWTYGLSDPREIEWPMFRHDIRHTGVYTP